jgi:hypothetical protein
MSDKHWSALPTWRLNKVLPASHPFSGKSLSDWHRGRTDLCKQFDAVFWSAGVSAAILVVFIALP